MDLRVQSEKMPFALKRLEEMEAVGERLLCHNHEVG
jgi:hypothetical protein